MAKSVEIQTPSRNILGCGTKLKGNIESDGDFRIDGTLIGTSSWNLDNFKKMIKISSEK